jgi:hypothetical protein
MAEQSEGPFHSIDYARADGDFTAVSTFHRGSDGKIYIDDIKLSPYRGLPPISQAVLDSCSGGPPVYVCGCFECGAVYEEKRGHICPRRNKVIFEYIVVQHPHKKDAEKGELESVITGPTVIVAKDAEHAKTTALLGLGSRQDDLDFDAKRIEVLVRPFK